MIDLDDETLGHYFDKDGSPLTFKGWAMKLEQEGKDYRRVAETILPDGTWISTVWVGLDMGYWSDRPIIFETMVFPSIDNMQERDMERYATLAEADQGHQAMVEKWSK